MNFGRELIGVPKTTQPKMYTMIREKFEVEGYYVPPAWIGLVSGLWCYEGFEPPIVLYIR